MKSFNIIILILVLTISASCKKSENIAASQGFIHAKGQRIAEGSGSEILLKGVGLGGWMLQEGYMLGTHGPQHEIREFLTSMAGEQATDEFYEDWLTYFVNETDVKQIADWGYNSIRLPMHYNLYFDEGGQWLPDSKGLELTDQLLEWCEKEELYLILDLHAAPGGQGNNRDISDRREGESLWTSDKAWDMTVKMWYELAKKYKDEKWIGGYDLLNEPNYDFDNTGDPKGCSCTENKPLLDLFETLIDTVRAVDKNHLLVVEGNCYGGNYNGLESLANYDPQNNLAFSFHFYWGSNTPASIQSMLDIRDTYNVPLWRGEIGENSNSWFTNMAELMNQFQIGWANWPWKKINNLDGPVIIDPIPGWDKLMAYKSDSSNPRPSQAEAQATLRQLIENIKLENCRLMHDVAYAYLNAANGEGTRAYSSHEIPGTIFMTDYDFGKISEVWYDTDYQNTSGRSSNTAWNKGMHYRNDGVDIWPTSDAQSNGYYVGKIEKNEWLQFTMDEIKSGTYSVIIRAKSPNNDNGTIMLSIDGQPLFDKAVMIPKFNDWEDLKVENINVANGKTLRVDFPDGGFDLSSIRFVEE
jgi:endoglucanase